MTAYTRQEAAVLLGLTPNGVMYRIKKGELKGRKTTKGWRVYLNGNEAIPEMRKIEDGNDELIEIANELIGMGKRLKRAIKEHDADVRRETIVDFAASIAEAAERGR